MSGNTVGGCVALLDTPDRDVGSIQLPRWGRVVPADDVVPWQVVDPHGVTVEPIQRFLRDFVAEGTSWAHLDIAGPAWNDGKPYGYVSSGGTGAGVRTLVALARSLAA